MSNFDAQIDHIAKSCLTEPIMQTFYKECTECNTTAQVWFWIDGECPYCHKTVGLRVGEGQVDEETFSTREAAKFLNISMRVLFNDRRKKEPLVCFVKELKHNAYYMRSALDKFRRSEAFMNLKKRRRI